MKKLLLLIVAAAAAAMSGCGSGLGSCSAAQGGAMVCVEYQSTAFTPELVRQSCSMQMGATYSSGGCPGANRVGRCTVTNGSGAASITQIQSYYAPITAGDAMMICTRINGMWASN